MILFQAYQISDNWTSTALSFPRKHSTTYAKDCPSSKNTTFDTQKRGDSGRIRNLQLPTEVPSIERIYRCRKRASYGYDTEFISRQSLKVGMTPNAGEHYAPDYLNSKCTTFKARRRGWWLRADLELSASNWSPNIKGLTGTPRYGDDRHWI